MASTKFDNIKKTAMIEALEKSLGVVTTAARQVGIDRTTHYVWMKDDPEYKKAADATAEIALDFVESKLFKNVEADNVTAQIFYLKTKGKNRGYIERSEHTGKDGETLVFRWKTKDDPK